MALLFLAFMAGMPDYIPNGSPLPLRMATYHFFHANMFHLAANCLVLWTLGEAWTYNPVRCRKELVLSYIIASLAILVEPRPVVGISNIIFAIVGMRTPKLSNPWWKNPNTLTFLGVMFAMLLVPRFSGVTHIISFAAGMSIAAIERFVNGLRKGNR